MATEFHVKMNKAVNHLGQERQFYTVYPQTTASDVITENLLQVPDIPSEVLSDIIRNLGSLAFKNTYQDASTTRKGIVQLSDSLDSESENTVPTSYVIKLLKDLIESKTITITTGTTDGTISVNGVEVPIAGLKSAAFCLKGQFATSEQGIKADNAMPLEGGTFEGPVYLNGAEPISGVEAVSKNYVDDQIRAVDQRYSAALIHIGVIHNESEIIVTGARKGYQYVIGTEGTYCGYECTPGDIIICEADGNVERTALYFSYVPSGNERETFISFSKTDVNLSETEQVGHIRFGEAATRQVSDNVTPSLDTTNPNLLSVKALLKYITDGDFATKGDLTHVKGAAEKTYRTGYVNLTAENIGAATAEQGEKADHSIQNISIGTVQSAEPDAEPSITVDTDPETMVSTLNFILPRANGEIGPTGPVGTMGPTGPQGIPGQDGIDGRNGKDGAPGPTGPIGPTGEIGPMGPTGERGPMGERGPTGFVGPTGPQGIPGPTGASGSDGEMGPTGPAGIRGAIIFYGEDMTETDSEPHSYPFIVLGTDASIGDTYINTDTGNVYECIQGGSPTVALWVYKFNITGPMGPTGATGEVGPTGPMGYIDASAIEEALGFPVQSEIVVSRTEPDYNGIWYNLISEDGATDPIVEPNDITNAINDLSISTINMEAVTYENPITVNRELHFIGNKADIPANSGDRANDTIADDETVFTGEINMSNGSNVTLEGLTLNNDAIVKLAAGAESLTIKNCKIVGISPSSNRAAWVQAFNSETPVLLQIEGCYFGSYDSEDGGRIYNGFEFDAPLKDSSYIKNCYFANNGCSHNSTSFYKLEENATFDFSDNVFEYSGNACRIGFKGDPVGTVNFERNTWLSTDPSDDYAWAGLVIVQPYSNKTSTFEHLTINMNENVNSSGISQDIYVYYAGSDTVIDENKMPTIYRDSLDVTDEVAVYTYEGNDLVKVRPVENTTEDAGALEEEVEGGGPDLDDLDDLEP